MKGSKPQHSEKVVLNIVGERVALGPLRENLLPLYGRWINDFGTIRMLGLPPGPVTAEKEHDWYEQRSKAEHDAMFTIYERETLRPIGNTALHGLDHRNRSASFGILIGEPDCRGKGYGTETTRLMGGKLWDEIYMDCLAPEFESPVLERVFSPDTSR